MSTPLPPDPYVALGVEKSATAAQIKTTYRKLVLKCHPDKVIDEAKKAEASDQFHRIQQAYEILSDEGRRSRYDAQVKLVELRKQAMNDKAPVEVKTTAYEMPTASPGRTTFTARGPERVYEERKPDKSDSDPDYFSSRTASRKHDGYQRPAKKPATPRDERERATVFEREKKDGERVLRSDKRKTRDKDTKRERDTKYSYGDEDEEADLAYEARRRREEGRKRDEDAQERERARMAREREERERERYREERERERERERPSRGYDKSARHYSQQINEVQAYLASSKRPSVSRTASRSSRPDTYIDRSSSDRPAFVMRRHSTKPTASSPQPLRRDRKMSAADVFEAPEDRRTAARPATLPRERSMPSRTMSMADERDIRDIPPIRRADTMPDMAANASPRRPKDPRGSNLRSTEISDGLPTPAASPDYVPTPSYTKTAYRYPDDDNYRRTDRDRDRPRITRSPSPMNRRSSAAPTSRYSQPAAPQPPPVLRTNYTYSPTTESPTSYTRPLPSRRDTSHYGELPKATTTKTYEYPSDSHRDYDKERYKRSPVMEESVSAGYASARRASASAHHSRPHLTRNHTTSGYAQGVY